MAVEHTTLTVGEVTRTGRLALVKPAGSRAWDGGTEERCQRPTDDGTTPPNKRRPFSSPWVGGALCHRRKELVGDGAPGGGGRGGEALEFGDGVHGKVGQGDAEGGDLEGGIGGDGQAVEAAKGEVGGGEAGIERKAGTESHGQPVVGGNNAGVVRRGEASPGLEAFEIVHAGGDHLDAQAELCGGLCDAGEAGFGDRKAVVAHEDDAAAADAGQMLDSAGGGGGVVQIEQADPGDRRDAGLFDEEADHGRAVACEVAGNLLAGEAEGDQPVFGESGTMAGTEAMKDAADAVGLHGVLELLDGAREEGVFGELETTVDQEQDAGEGGGLRVDGVGAAALASLDQAFGLQAGEAQAKSRAADLQRAGEFAFGQEFPAGAAADELLECEVFR